MKSCRFIIRRSAVLLTRAMTMSVRMGINRPCPADTIGRPSDTFRTPWRTQLSAFLGDKQEFDVRKCPADKGCDFCKSNIIKCLSPKSRLGVGYPLSGHARTRLQRQSKTISTVRAVEGRWLGAVGLARHVADVARDAWVDANGQPCPYNLCFVDVITQCSDFARRGLVKPCKTRKGK